MIDEKEIRKEINNMLTYEKELIKEMFKQINEHGDYYAHHLHELATLHIQRTTLEWVLEEA